MSTQGHEASPLHFHFNIIETVKDITASVAGSAACVYTGQPFDTIKVRMQVQAGKFLGPVHCLKTTVVGEGISALWRGSIPAFLGALAENAMAFAVNEQLTRTLCPENNLLPEPLVPFVTGGITGFFSAFALCPMDVVKCRSQLSRATGGSGNFMSIIGSTIRTDGMKGLYRGIGAQILRDMPFYLFFFGTYSTIRDYLKDHAKLPETVTYIAAGGLAGQIGWVMSIPSDTVKSVIQTSATPVTIRATVQHIYATRGVRGFFNGLQIAVIRAFPANAALFLAYEFTRKAIA